MSEVPLYVMRFLWLCWELEEPKGHLIEAPLCQSLDSTLCVLGHAGYRGTSRIRNSSPP